MYPLRDLLKLSQIARSTYYYHLESYDKDKYAVEKQAIISIFNENKGSYGYRKVLLSLKQLGYVINHKTVLKSMKSLNSQGKQHKGKYKSYKGEVGKIANNVIARDFESRKTYEKLTTDVTELAVSGEKVYLSAVLDMCNNEIVSYSIGKSPNFWQTRDMLNKLFMRLPKTAKPILHSDQGWQYQMKEFQRCCFNITQSMSRK